MTTKPFFFTESPPKKRGIAYLGWLRPTGRDKLDDEWIYLPELRSTRRIPHRGHEHSHDDDEFGNSLVSREHLEPRPPQLDDHKIIGEQDFNGQPHYLISSTAYAMGVTTVQASALTGSTKTACALIVFSFSTTTINNSST